MVIAPHSGQLESYLRYGSYDPSHSADVCKHFQALLMALTHKVRLVADPNSVPTSAAGNNSGARSLVSGSSAGWSL